jgi:hypothetical protein
VAALNLNNLRTNVNTNISFRLDFENLPEGACPRAEAQCIS